MKTQIPNKLDKVTFTLDEARMIGVLLTSAMEVLEHGPCGDPDCCSTAIHNRKARQGLRDAINEMEDKGFVERVWKSH